MVSAEVMAKMAAQVAAIRAEWAGRKQYAGTGFHPSDPSFKMRRELGQPDADDRVIGVQSRHDTFFFGDDAKHAMDVLECSIEDLQVKKMADAPDGPRPGDDSAALREGKEVVAHGMNGDGVLQIRNTQLTAILWALERMGVWSVIVGLDP